MRLVLSALLCLMILALVGWGAWQMGYHAAHRDLQRELADSHQFADNLAEELNEARRTSHEFAELSKTVDHITAYLDRCHAAGVR